MDENEAMGTELIEDDLADVELGEEVSAVVEANTVEHVEEVTKFWKEAISKIIPMYKNMQSLRTDLNEIAIRINNEALYLVNMKFAKTGVYAYSTLPPVVDSAHKKMYFHEPYTVTLFDTVSATIRERKVTGLPGGPDTLYHLEVDK